MFYPKGCQDQSSPSTGGREDFCLEIQPTDCKCPPISLEGFCSGLSALPVGFIFRWFYKKGCSIQRDVKTKVLPRPEAEKIFVSRSSPLTVSAPRFRSRGFALACLPFL